MIIIVLVYYNNNNNNNNNINSLTPNSNNTVMALKRLSILRHNVYDLLFNTKFVVLNGKELNDKILKQTYDLRTSLIGLKADEVDKDYTNYIEFHKNKEVYMTLVTSKPDNDVIGYVSWRRLNLHENKFENNIIMEAAFAFFKSIQKTDKDGNIKRYSNPFIGMRAYFLTFSNLTKIYPANKYNIYALSKMYPSSYLAVSGVFKDIVCLKDDILDQFQRETLIKYYKQIYGSDAEVSHVMVMPTKPLPSEINRVPKTKYNRILYDKYIKMNPDFADGKTISVLIRFSFSDAMKSLFTKYFSK